MNDIVEWPDSVGIWHEIRFGHVYKVTGEKDDYNNFVLERISTSGTYWDGPKHKTLPRPVEQPNSKYHKEGPLHIYTLRDYPVSHYHAFWDGSNFWRKLI